MPNLNFAVELFEYKRKVQQIAVLYQLMEHLKTVYMPNDVRAGAVMSASFDGMTLEVESDTIQIFIQEFEQRIDALTKELGGNDGSQKESKSESV